MCLSFSSTVSLSVSYNVPEVHFEAVDILIEIKQLNEKINQLRSSLLWLFYLCMTSYEKD